MSSTLRQRFMDALPKRRSTVIEHDGQKYEVKQATMAERALILAAGGIEGKKEQNGSAMLIEAVLLCTYEPGTNNRVFELSDRDALMQSPAGSIVQQLGVAAVELMRVDVEEAKKP